MGDILQSNLLACVVDFRKAVSCVGRKEYCSALSQRHLQVIKAGQMQGLNASPRIGLCFLSVSDKAIFSETLYDFPTNSLEVRTVHKRMELFLHLILSLASVSVLAENTALPQVIAGSLIP